ncbi:hypothetical protein C5B93_15875 [Rathayibacter sp. AY1A2]|nr:hypothetical protein C5B93_15875 [Rathayibacter sp. AY1A2]PPH26854.1 hypothetical protein C5C94_16340 [Rathayibacter sp. AY1C3]
MMRLTDEEWDFQANVTVLFDSDAMRYEITAISISGQERAGRPAPITAKSLRLLLINKLEEKIFSGSFPLLVMNERMLSFHAYGFEGLENGAAMVRGEGPTPKALAFAASVYCFYFAIRGKPTQRIAELMQLPPSTASHWVRLARQRGYLSKDSTKSIDYAPLIGEDEPKREPKTRK